MTPQELSQQLRRGEDPFLSYRRGIVGLSLVSMASLGLVALYQMGIIDHVPEPPLPGFDADKVNGSPDAYAILATPDAFLGLGSYAATMALAAMGGEDRAATRPWIPLALAAKAGFDVAQAARLTLNEATKQKAFCLPCLLTSGCTAGTALLVIPEARAALQRIMGKMVSAQ